MFLRRILGRGRPRADQWAPLYLPIARQRTVAEVERPAQPSPVACPNCATVLDPPPSSTRLCPRCRRRIVVRHAGGRAIYLTEAAVEVFESERQREIDEQTWERDRRRWLQLARLAAAPVDRRQRIAAGPADYAAVQAARALYLAAADRAVREARQQRRWEDVARIRQRQAAALFDEAQRRLPVPDDILALYLEGVSATLRGLAVRAREVELVGASCCSACRADNERIFRVAAELRTARLPHPGCPRGLCACDWWPTVRQPRPATRRRRSATVRPEAAGPRPG